jgi:hypothetical protein
LELVDCFLGVLGCLRSDISLDKVEFCAFVVEINELPVVVDGLEADCDDRSLSFERDSTEICLLLVSCEDVDAVTD